MKRLAFLLALLIASPVWAVGPVKFDVIDLTTGARIGGAATSGQYLRGNGTNFVSGAIAAGDLPAGFVDAVADLAGGLCAASEVLKKNAGNTAWECAADAGGSALPVADTTSIVEGSADATKEIRFEVDGLTTGTVRVLTSPDADIVLAGSASALTSGRIPIATTSGLLTDDADFTWDATNNRLAIANGTVATDNSTKPALITGSLPTVPTGQVSLFGVTATGAGSAAFNQLGAEITLLAGYTGGNVTGAISTFNNTVGTGATLNLTTDALGNANYSIFSQTTGAGAGYNIGTGARASGSTGINVGNYGLSASTAAGSNIGGLGAAGNSTEGTGLVNVGLLGTTDSALPAANVSAGVLAAAAAGDFPLRAYYDDTEVMRIDDSVTALDTYLMIYDVDNATLERVTVGAADSGGTGFKLLRIAN